MSGYAGEKRSCQQFDYPQLTKRFKLDINRNHEFCEQRAMSQIVYHDKQEIEYEFNKCLSLYLKVSLKHSKHTKHTMSQVINGKYANRNKKNKKHNKNNRNSIKKSQNNPWDRKMIDFLETITSKTNNLHKYWMRSSLAIDMSVKIYQQRVDNLRDRVFKLLSIITSDNKVLSDSNNNTQSVHNKQKTNNIHYIKKTLIASNNTNNNNNMNNVNNINGNKYIVNRFNIIRQKLNLILLSNEWWHSSDGSTPWICNDNIINNENIDFCNMLLNDNVNGFNFNTISQIGELNIINKLCSKYFHKIPLNQNMNQCNISNTQQIEIEQIEQIEQIEHIEQIHNIQQQSIINIPTSASKKKNKPKKQNQENQRQNRKNKTNRGKRKRKRKRIHNNHQLIEPSSKKRKYNNNEIESWRNNNSNDNNNEYDFSLYIPQQTPHQTPERSASIPLLITPNTPLNIHNSNSSNEIELALINEENELEENTPLMSLSLSLLSPLQPLQQLHQLQQLQTERRKHSQLSISNGSKINKLNKCTYDILFNTDMNNPNNNNNKSDITFIKLLFLQFKQYPYLTIPMSFLSLLTVCSDSYPKNENQSHLLNINLQRHTMPQLNDFHICISNHSS